MQIKSLETETSKLYLKFSASEIKNAELEGQKVELLSQFDSKFSKIQRSQTNVDDRIKAINNQFDVHINDLENRWKNLDISYHEQAVILEDFKERYNNESKINESLRNQIEKIEISLTDERNNFADSHLKLSEKINDLNLQIETHISQLSHLELEKAQTLAELNRIQESFSYRVAKPVRIAGATLRFLKRSAKAIVRKILKITLHIPLLNGFIKYSLFFITTPFPLVKHKFKLFYATTTTDPIAFASRGMTTEKYNLTPLEVTETIPEADKPEVLHGGISVLAKSILSNIDDEAELPEFLKPIYFKVKGETLIEFNGDLYELKDKIDVLAKGMVPQK
jgi:hypothetical protein